MHVLVTRAKIRVTQAMGSQSCRQQQYALDLAGNVGAEVRLGRTISWKCHPQKYGRETLHDPNLKFENFYELKAQI